MRALLALLACLLAAAPAAADRPRTGWTGQQGFSHYFPLSPEERSRPMALQQAQRVAGGQGGAAFVPRPGAAGGGAPPSCGWAGCAQGAGSPGGRGLQSVQTPQVCGWAGCRQGGAAQLHQTRTDVCGWAGCRQGGAAQLHQTRTDVCGWAGCRGGGSAAPALAGGGADGGFRDRCGWAGCR